jgi:Asp/Glu/hydantoin racemase
MARLAYIHTVPGLASTFAALSRELLPGVDVFHIVDESLLQNTIRAGSLTQMTTRRLAAYLVSAQEAGADLAMVTCSSVGPAVDISRPMVNIPVYRVDQPMVDQAVRTGSRIGVLATLQSTLNPTASLVRTRAQAAGREVEVVTRLCEGAFDAVVAGDTQTHDALVRQGLEDLAAQVDVVLLAQASMARLADSLPGGSLVVPVLSSPRLAVQHLAAEIAALEDHPAWR